MTAGERESATASGGYVMTVLTINLKQFIATSDEFFDLCQTNPTLQMERTAAGEVIVMSPADSKTSARNAGITGQLWQWNEDSELGITFDSSGGFHLPNGADRSPDAAWILAERWNALTPREQQKFAPICPDFVVELRSSSDYMPDLRDKMQEYIDNGARLGWLIDPETPTVEIYEPGEEVETLYNPERVAGDPVLPGFLLNMKRVWG